MPEFWDEFADAWLQGFDGEPPASAGKAKSVSADMELEVDEVAVGDAPPP